MRQVLEFNTRWAFSKEAESRPETMPNKWIWVNLPHTWNNIDGIDGGNDYYRGTCWYANEVDKTEWLPKADEYYLEFEGANSSADVYVNGKHLAHHDGGYSTWRVNVTEEFNQADKPLVVVSVDNSPNREVYPQMADFTFYGGLYRDVKIICVNESHFDLDYYGAPGVKVTPIVKNEDADVEVEVFTANVKEGQTLTYTIKYPCGRVVDTKTVPVSETKVHFDMKNVHKWHGRKDPYLYTCEVTLNENEEVLDNVSTRFGVRTFRIDSNEGFFLNDEYYPLRGVSRHQDRWGER